MISVTHSHWMAQLRSASIKRAAAVARTTTPTDAGARRRRRWHWRPTRDDDDDDDDDDEHNSSSMTQHAVKKRKPLGESLERLEERAPRNLLVLPKQKRRPEKKNERSAKNKWKKNECGGGGGRRLNDGPALSGAPLGSYLFAFRPLPLVDAAPTNGGRRKSLHHCSSSFLSFFLSFFFFWNSVHSLTDNIRRGASVIFISFEWFWFKSINLSIRYMEASLSLKNNHLKSHLHQIQVLLARGVQLKTDQNEIGLSRPFF